MKTEEHPHPLVKAAVQGSQDALEELIRQIQQPVYSLALRMLLDRQDAEDAAQEIIIRVITHLRIYRFEGSFRARVRMKGFLAGNCSLLEDANRCRCGCILLVYLQKRWIHPDRPMFADRDDTGESPARLGDYLKEMDELGQLTALYRSASPSSPDFVARVRRIYDDPSYRILADPDAGVGHSQATPSCWT